LDHGLVDLSLGFKILFGSWIDPLLSGMLLFQVALKNLDIDSEEVAVGAFQGRLAVQEHFVGFSDLVDFFIISIS
jgi:hypothetical protein